MQQLKNWCCIAVLRWWDCKNTWYVYHIQAREVLWVTPFVCQAFWGHLWHKIRIEAWGKQTSVLLQSCRSVQLKNTRITSWNILRHVPHRRTVWNCLEGRSIDVCKNSSANELRGKVWLYRRQKNYTSSSWRRIAVNLPTRPPWLTVLQ